MARVRSPNYPAFGLPEAISRVKAVHAKEQHLAAPKEVIAKHLGYSGINGGSLKAISALIKYGLLEETSGDKMKVSALAVRILYPEDQSDHAQAIAEAGSKPPLFGEIAAEYEGGRPSDESLRSYLIRRQFSKDAVDRVIQAYRDTMELVAQESGVYGAGQSGAKPQAGPEKPRMQGQTYHQGRATGETMPHSGQPMSVSFTGDRLHVSAVLEDAEAVDKLVKALTANKALLPQKRERGSNEPTQDED